MIPPRARNSRWARPLICLTTSGLVAATACARAPIAPAPSPESRPAATDVFVAAPTPERGRAALSGFEPDVAAEEGSFVCTNRDHLSATTTTVFASFPSAAKLRATVVVTVDSAGKLLRYAERRGPQINPTIGPNTSPSVAVAAAADSVRSTTITLDYERGLAIVSNRGGGRPAQSVSAPVGAVASLDRLGNPLARANRVLAQCGAKVPT
ncbi:MAG: hypothetical protein ABJE47_04825 [bacterium]